MLCGLGLGLLHDVCNDDNKTQLEVEIESISSIFLMVLVTIQLQF